MKEFKHLFFDTHVHFALLDQGRCASSPDHVSARENPAEIIRRATDAGVTRMLAIGGDPDADKQAVLLARQYPGNIKAAVGLDRSQEPRPELFIELENRVVMPEIVAIGETGLDFHYTRDAKTQDTQRMIFRRMLELAQRRQLPVIVHSRNADCEILEDLTVHAQNWRGPPVGIGVMHCFTGGPDYARALMELGFSISFSGIITFKNADDLRRTAAIIPDDRLLLETDAPFLAPEPHRGRRNEPAYLIHTAACLAQIRGQSVETVACQTTANAELLFTLEREFELRNTRNPRK